VKTKGYEPEPETRDLRGEVIAGRYRLDTPLGRGGMGFVYRAQHLQLDEPVVVKFIDPAYAGDPIARSRFRREAKALIRLRHPGIVTMHELGEHAGGLFLAMELLEGRTLGARLASQPPPCLDEVFALFRQLGEVLDAIHAAGVWHRDLKPDNVMLVPARVSGDVAERAVLMDFGLAYLDEGQDVRVTSTGAVMGTPAYMAPEQCDGSGAGPASDLYALGVMLFEALTGHRPFESDTAAVAMSQHMFVAPPKLERTAAGQVIPPGLVKLVEDLLGKKPSARPTAMELLQRLEGARTGNDALGFSAAASARRLADLGKTREERAFAANPTVGVSTESILGSEQTLLASDAARPVVWMRGFAGERASRLVASLAVNGVEAICSDSTDHLAADLRGELRVAILPGDGTIPAPELVRQVRQAPEHEQLPVLVIDVPDAAALAELIRAGASDVALSVLGDDVVVSKTWRLIRRKR
jgi:serine/threonine protein kinase